MDDVSFQILLANLIESLSRKRKTTSKKKKKKKKNSLFVSIQTVYLIDYLLFLRKTSSSFFETMNQENNPPSNDLDDEKLSFVTFRKKVCFIYLFHLIYIYYLSLSVG